MRTEATAFYSEGLKLDASFYLPDEGNEDPSRPLIVVCSGFMGLNSIHPARFARALTPLGYTTFGFDYRGFAASEGPPGRVLIEEQVTDIACAAAFAAQHRNAGGGRVVLMGWGMGGGLVLEAARLVPRVAGIVCMNGFYNGKRVQKAVRGWDGYVEFMEKLDAARARSATTGEVVEVEPFSIYPVDSQSGEYVDNVLYRVPEFGGLFKPMLADSLLRFAPDANLEDFGRVPLLIAHGEKNRMHPPTEAESLYSRYPGPKEIFWLWGAGHTEFMDDDNPTFKRLAGAVANFLQTQVVDKSW
jgi:pimeloyl-ACP methyl ester carboxylesterase